MSDEEVSRYRTALEQAAGLSPEAVGNMTPDDAQRLMRAYNAAWFPVEVKLSVSGIGSKQRTEFLAARGVHSDLEARAAERLYKAAERLKPDMQASLEREMQDIAKSLPGYDVYIRQSMVSGALLLASGSRLAITEVFLNNGAIPKVAEGGIMPSKPYAAKGVSDISYRDGVIKIAFDGEVVEGGEIRLVARPKSSDSLEWTCRSNELIRRYAPGSCR